MYMLAARGSDNDRKRKNIMMYKYEDAYRRSRGKRQNAQSRDTQIIAL